MASGLFRIQQFAVTKLHECCDEIDKEAKSLAKHCVITKDSAESLVEKEFGDETQFIFGHCCLFSTSRAESDSRSMRECVKLGK